MKRPRLLFLSLGGTITMVPSSGGGIAPTPAGVMLDRQSPSNMQTNSSAL